MKNSYISVAGTMGVGKSSLVKIISKEFGYIPILENFSVNPFLPKFYKDMKRWSFHSQVFFLFEKIGQIHSIHQMKGKKIVQDTPIYQDVFSYAKAQRKLNNMSQHEWNLYFKAYQRLENILIIPDIIIYLDCPIDEIYQRMMKRDRKYETVTKKKLLLSYLNTLHELNQEWLTKISKKIKIVRINTEGYNYVKNKKKRFELLNNLEKLL